MTHTTYEMMWLKNLIGVLGFAYSKPLPMHYDNQVPIHIASNLVFHERTKYIDVDCHFVRNTVLNE